MSKSSDRLTAIRLRKQGKSLNYIIATLGVAKSTASLWTRHVHLSSNQINQLKNNSLIGSAKGRLLGSLKQKLARLQRIDYENKLGIAELGTISDRELKLIGLSLYWTEGSKKTRRVELCNSDPKMIVVFIRWLNRIYNIPLNELTCYVGINIAHQSREFEVKNYWSKVTGLPLNRFTKTSFKKYPLRKTYTNFSSHFGTLSLKVRKPARIYYKIMGQIHGLSMAT